MAKTHDHTHDHNHSDGHNHDHAAPENKQPTMLAPDTRLDLVIPWATVQPVYEKVSRKVAGRVKIDGFRKGKVPAYLAKQVIRQEQIIELTLEEVVPSAYVALITKEKKRPLGNPEFHPEKIEVGQDWKLHVHIAEKPEIKLGDWKKIATKASENYQAEKKRIEKEEAKKTKNAKSEQSSQAPQPAEPTQADQADKARSDQLGMIYSALVTAIRPQIPELLVKQEATSQLRQLGEQLERFNLTFDSFLQQRNLTQDQLTNQVAAEALSRLQLAFIIDALVLELQLQPTAAELEKELSDKTAEIRDYYDKNSEARAALEHRLAQQKLEEHLLSL